MSTLILIRHGKSQWNSENRFTGWVDTPLSDQGRKEAVTAGQRLAERGVQVDRAFTSTLQRAIETGRIVLDELGQSDLEQIQAWELNERFYGALTGRDKAQTAQEFGEEQVRIWRRSYDIPPPGGESLADTGRRALPYFHNTIIPATRDVGTVLVAAHGNSIRALIKDLENISDADIVSLEVGTAVPIVYQLDDGKVVGKEVLDA
jgi:2,3-bisphosphoglycerate-dependent phosphoglycerate mutase